MKALPKIILAAALLLLQACTNAPIRDWPAEEGRVLDAQTEQPIEGAFVVMRWIGYGGYSQSQCFHVDVAETDARGRFHIPEWHNDQRSATLVDQRRNIDVVHKPGYRFAERTYREQSQKKGVWYLEADRRPAGERLEYLQRMLGISSCDNSNVAYKLGNAFDEIYMEATEICDEQCDSKLLNSIHYQRDVVKYGWEAAQDRKRKGEYK